MCVFLTLSDLFQTGVCACVGLAPPLSPLPFLLLTGKRIWVPELWKEETKIADL